jgi:superfamily II DNA or RNA helicase
MNSNKGYIYIREHEYYKLDNICKLGKTIKITNRDNIYATGEYKRGLFTLVIEILDNQKLDYINAIYVEKLLQKYFKNYHRKINGGNEFYQINIINKIVPFLSNTIINFKVLSNEDINNIFNQERKEVLIKVLKKFYQNKLNENRLRNELQEFYVMNIIDNLNNDKRTFLKAPTGFGKTHIYYKIIQRMNLKRILFLTPRILLNHQIVEKKYSFYLNSNFKFHHFSNLDNYQQKRLLKDYSKNNKEFIMTCCYQSNNKLLNYIKKYNFVFDLIIFDEAHYITSWTDNQFLNDNICKYRLFGSATPTQDIENNQLNFGKIIEKIKVYELINKKLLCNIETIVKKLNEKKTEYHNLQKLIVDSMIKFNKKKGIIYVNDCKNAENLYKLLKNQNKINVYIFVSKNIDVYSENDKDIKSFENDTKQCVIICVGKIGYGYDNDYIDFICLGDPRQSDIDIRQIIGRGLRWKKDNYPNKLLHLLVPLYRDEFGYTKNEHLKKYLDYIIGECGQDIIFKNNGNIVIGNQKQIDKQGEIYDGEDIPTEILREYCTTGYNKFTNFIKFLKNNKIFDEISYNKLKENQNWLVSLGEIHKKYPKFCFRDIHPLKYNFYWNKKEASEASIIAKDLLIKKIGRDNYSELTFEQIIKKYNLIDPKIPNIDIDLYYSII